MEESSVARFGDQRVKVGEYANGKPKYVTRRHYAKIKLAEKKLGYPITVVQGSYHTGVKASAGTHDGGGCLDLAPFDWKHKCRVFRELGDTAWHRAALPDVWSEHIHTVDLGSANLASICIQQVKDYRANLDGLKHPKKDPQWRPDPIPSFKLTAAMISTLWPQRPARRVRRVDLHKVRAQAESAHPTPNPGVKQIQRALNKAIRAGLLVDGKFGDVTKRAYTAWQQSLGFSGADADGLPAKVSLTKLSQTRGARFTVTL
jgi:hypothetical protein